MAIEFQSNKHSLVISNHFDEANQELKLIRYVFQNNRSSAPPIVMMDGEASVGYLLFWLIHTNHTEADDEMRNCDEKW